MVIKDSRKPIRTRSLHTTQLKSSVFNYSSSDSHYFGNSLLFFNPRALIVFQPQNLVPNPPLNSRRVKETRIPITPFEPRHSRPPPPVALFASPKLNNFINNDLHPLFHAWGQKTFITYPKLLKEFPNSDLLLGNSLELHSVNASLHRSILLTKKPGILQELLSSCLQTLPTTSKKIRLVKPYKLKFESLRGSGILKINVKEQRTMIRPNRVKMKNLSLLKLHTTHQITEHAIQPLLYMAVIKLTIGPATRAHSFENSIKHHLRSLTSILHTTFTNRNIKQGIQLVQQPLRSPFLPFLRTSLQKFLIRRGTSDDKSSCCNTSHRGSSDPTPFDFNRTNVITRLPFQTDFVQATTKTGLIQILRHRYALLLSGLPTHTFQQGQSLTTSQICPFQGAVAIWPFPPYAA
ncbi:uncharacterized protein G2W53_010476 [Senna tora]|uniref:Uncharacterized protein n=1 Tax=Senna tora TaxID=362788 RepID=A0A834X126_9FABA|nr:uncharacterized protein G2W53_010476 [Senna tora]